MKKIKVVVPVATPIWDEVVLKEMQKYKDSDTLIEICHLETGAESIENAFDEAWCALPTLLEVIKAEKEGYDGVIIYCYGDPGLKAAREGVNIPVVAIGEASAHIASIIGRKFGIITAGPPEAGPYLLDNLKVYELDHKCVGVRSLGIPVMSLIGTEQDALTALLRVGKEMVEQGADVLILGCGSILGIADKASRELGVPIVLPAAASIKLCESLIAMGISQSKKGYPAPHDKKRIK